MNTVPVYLITGFLDSGKTTFLKDTLEDSEFLDGEEQTVLILCEEGEEEYDTDILAEKNVTVLTVDEEEDLNPRFLMDIKKKYKPEKVMIEFNGTWSTSKLLENGFPGGWELAQVITTVDASTFEGYMSNMRQMMVEQIGPTELVIFNRCTAETKKNSFRKAVKTFNRRAQVVYESLDGEDGIEDEIELPYNMDAPIIEIEDDDYGIFYLDALDDPKKYEGKKVQFTAMVYRGKEIPKGTFVPGRFAMTCCADDITFIGFICKGEQANYFKMREWVKVTANIKCEYHKEYEGEGPVLYLEKIELTKKPEEHLLYMN